MATQVKNALATGNGGTGLTTSGANGNCLVSNGTNWTSGSCSGSSSTNFSAVIPDATNSHSGTFAVSGNTWDFSAAALFKLRIAAGCSTSTNGDLCYDTTNNKWLMWQGGANKNFIAASNLGASGQPCLSNADGSCTFADPIVSGPDAVGVAPTRNPVQIGCLFLTSPATLTNNEVGALQCDSTQHLFVNVTNFPATQPVSGTVTANAGTNLNTSALALDTSVNGLLLGQGSTTSGQKGPLAQGAVTTSAPSYTTAQTSPLSLNTSGGLRVDGSGVTQPVSAASLPLPSGAATAANQCGASSPCEVSATSSANGVSNPIYTGISDATNGPAAVKAASTAAVAADKALVVAISPNNSVAVTGTFFQTTQPVSCASGATCPTNATLQSPAAGTYVGSVTPQPSSVSGDAASGCYVQSGTGTTASTNATNCKSSAGNFYGVASAVNTTGTIAYLRMYNTSAAPTCSSSTGFIESIPIPSNNNTNTVGAGVVRSQIFGINYSTGISFCVTGGGGNTDNTNAPAGVYITLLYK